MWFIDEENTLDHQYSFQMRLFTLDSHFTNSVLLDRSKIHGYRYLFLLER